MQRYRLFRQKSFESLTKFEIRLNEECARDWHIVNISSTSPNKLTALLERDSRP